MKRADWLDKMWETIEAHEGRAFAWGVDDCCLFAARVYDAMHDTHHAEALAARYHDEASALEYIETQGGIGPAVCEYLGEMRRTRPMRGDVVLVENAGREMLGICTGRAVAALGPDGPVTLPKASVMGVW
jgi:hypothetical protein